MSAKLLWLHESGHKKKQDDGTFNPVFAFYWAEGSRSPFRDTRHLSR